MKQPWEEKWNYDGEGVVNQDYVYIAHDPITKSAAALLAAAPDLYCALKRILMERLKSGVTSEEAYSDAFEALKKARGETP